MTEQGAQVQVHVRAVGGFLAAAAGDALGWPQERRSGSRTSRPRPEPTFIHWRRFAGTRYQPFDQSIGVGEYSDDTQLLLCVGRSLLYGSEWTKALSRVELPTWLLYERGGGATVKRSARAWAKGTPPWSVKNKAKDREQYFGSGANGVAMRVLPHAVVGARDPAFDQIADRVLKDGILTHGHPRALIGALAYAYALWFLFQRQAALRFTELVEATLQGAPDWSAPPNREWLPREWAEGFREIHGETDELWERSAGEMVQLLESVLKALEAGAASDDVETLSKLGCQDPEIYGAGTVTAAGALYIASRYAAEPVTGLTQAAFLEEGDTDTLASMTGGLLGILHGPGWLGRLAESVQDRTYLTTLGHTLGGPPESRPPRDRPPPVSEKELRKFRDQLTTADPGAELALPDGRRVRLEEKRSLPTPSDKIEPVEFVLDAGSETLFVTYAAKAKPARPAVPVVISPGVPVDRIGLGLSVRDLRRSRAFYADVVGLEPAPPDEQDPTSVRFRAGLRIVHDPEMEVAPKGRRTGYVLRVAVSSLEELRGRLENDGARILTRDLRSRPRRLVFLDPDGHPIEALEVRASAPGA